LHGLLGVLSCVLSHREDFFSRGFSATAKILVELDHRVEFPGGLWIRFLHFRNEVEIFLHLLKQWDRDHCAVEHKRIKWFDLCLFFGGEIGRGHQFVLTFG
jgi:hypothetical protein